MKLEGKIVLLRKEKGLTQHQVAEKINVSRQAISKWESGLTMPSIDNLKSLGELYGVPVDYLLNDDIESVNCQSNVTEKPDSQPSRRKHKRLLIAVCVIVLLIAGVLIYRTAMAEQPKTFEFDELERDEWDTTGADEFSITW